MLILAGIEIDGLTVGPAALLLLAIPVVMLGEMIVRRVDWVQRSNVPPAILGGLLAALFFLACAEWIPGRILVQGNSANPYWLWPVLPQWNFSVPRLTDVERPFLILFFTCIG